MATKNGYGYSHSYKPAPRKRHFRNCESYSVHQQTVRQAGALGPRDPGDISQGPSRGVYATQAEAEKRADALRASKQWPEGVCFAVILRWHDEKGKVTDSDGEVYVI